MHYAAAALPARTTKINLLLIICTVIFGLAYFLQINSLSTKGYEIRRLEQKIKSLELEQKHLEMQSSSLQSISRIQEQANKLNLVPINNVAFIKDSDYALK